MILSMVDGEANRSDISFRKNGEKHDRNNL